MYQHMRVLYRYRIRAKTFGAKRLIFGLRIPLLPYLSMREAMALARLGVGAGSSEPSLFANAISAKILCPGAFIFY